MNKRKQRVKVIEEVATHQTRPRVVDIVTDTTDTKKVTSAVETAMNKSRWCGHRPTPVARLGDIELLAASKLHLGPAPDADLIINVTEEPVFNRVLVSGPAQFETLNQYVTQELHLQWEDGEAFPAGCDFWRALYDLLVGAGMRRVIVCCLGGHGRTGTALLSLILANSSIGHTKALINLRTVYCSEVVETITQDEYLAEIEREAQQAPRDFQLIWSEPSQMPPSTQRKIVEKCRYCGVSNDTVVDGECTMCWREKWKC